MRERIFRAHARDCFMRRSKRGHPWGLVADSYCLRHPSTGARLRWAYVVWGCNDPKCDALCGVPHRFVYPKFIKEPPR